MDYSESIKRSIDYIENNIKDDLNAKMIAQQSGYSTFHFCRIFTEWFPQSDYVFDETKVDFEFYDERCHGLENAVMDIYVPILTKVNET